MHFFSAATIILLAPLVRSQAVAGAAAPAPAAPAAPGQPAAPGAAAPAAPAPGGVAPGGGAPVATTIHGQVPSVTEITIPSTLPNGQITQIQTLFTQTFNSVPSKYPSAKAGSVGLGTLTGKVGAVKTTTAASRGGPVADGVDARVYLSIAAVVAGSALLGFAF